MMELIHEQLTTCKDKVIILEKHSDSCL
jgi:hypothetical protein